MNEPRRKALRDLEDRIEKLKMPFTVLAVSLKSIRDDLVSIREEEQEFYDNMPESIQAGQRGDEASQAIESLEEAESALEELLEALPEDDSTLDAIIQSTDAAKA